MALAAAQVVDAVQALLAPVGLTGGRVYTSRLWPLTEAELPAGRVFATEEEIELQDIHGHVQQHTLSIEARGYVRATADLDDSMNALAAVWLTALFAGTPPNNLRSTGIERETTNEGEASVGVVTLRLQAQFFTQPSAPETIL